jgi:hypothetical protein
MLGQLISLQRLNYSAASSDAATGVVGRAGRLTEVLPLPLLLLLILLLLLLTQL